MNYAENLLKDETLLTLFLVNTHYLTQNNLTDFKVGDDGWIYFKRDDESKTNFEKRLSTHTMYKEDLFIDNYKIYHANGKENDRMSKLLRTFGVVYYGNEYLNDVLSYLPIQSSERAELEQKYLNTHNIKAQFNMPHSYKIFESLTSTLMVEVVLQYPGLFDRFAKVLEPDAEFIIHPESDKQGNLQCAISTKKGKIGELNKYIFDGFQIRSNYSDLDTASLSGLWRNFLIFNLPEDIKDDYKEDSYTYSLLAMKYLKVVHDNTINSMLNSSNYPEQKQAYLDFKKISAEMAAIVKYEKMLHADSQK